MTLTKNSVFVVLIAGLMLAGAGPSWAAAKKKAKKTPRSTAGLKEEGKGKKEKKEASPASEDANKKQADTSEVLVAPQSPIYKDTELDALATSLLDDVEREQLGVDARFDLAFLTGNSVTQGFSLPSLRLSAWGDVTSILSYRLSFGQTREFTSALLPQLLPVEAYIDLGSTAANRAESRYAIRVGLFTPKLNPWWTPDLSDIPLPSYNLSHREIYLFRELGAELRYHSATRNLEAALGIFNGVGLFSQNTNNSKAGSAYFKAQIPFEEWVFYAGLGGYGRLQSSSGNVNYKRDWLVTGFVGVNSPYGLFQGEYSIGDFETSTAIRRASGAAIIAFINMSPRLRMFIRYEILHAPPSGGAGALKALQLGPVMQLHETLSLFGTYAQTQTADGSPPTHAGEVRFRLNI